MVDISVFLKETALVEESQKKRFSNVEIVSEIVEQYNTWNSAKHNLDLARKKLNDASKELGQLMKSKEKDEAKIAEKKEQAAELKKSIPEYEKNCKEARDLLESKIPIVGNLVHESVPVSKDEANNEVVRTWGDEHKISSADFPLQHHHHLLYRIGGYDPERGVKVAGHRGYFLTGVGVLLNLALVNFSSAFLMKKDYELLTVPLMVKKTIISECCQLSDFDEQLYKIGDNKPLDVEAEKAKGKTEKQIAEEEEDREKYLIATSEQPISAFHRGENIDPKNLPIRYGGLSTCFRKEAGKSGHDAWGIYRVHQFDKVEQFCLTDPEKSWEMHEEMIKTSEEYYQALKIPYRVVNIVSGELNNAAAKKYDLEGWFPAYTPKADYRELVSCSNCTDYQSRRLNVKFGLKTNEDPKKKFVHMLNSTLCATTRTICCILENYQTADGVRVPEVLVPYMMGKTFLPFVRDLPQEKKTGKGKK